MCIVILFYNDIFKGIERKSLDFRFLCRGTIPVNPNIVIIGIDDEALDKIKDPFIFWGPYFAAVIKAVADGGAKSIGLDFLQTIALKKKIDGKDLDSVMARALMEAENVIMINLLRWDSTLNGFKAINPIPKFLYASDPDNVGYSNLSIDNDGTVRRQILLMNDVEQNIYAYIGLKIIAKYLNSPIVKHGNTISVNDYIIPVNRYNEIIINFAGPSGTFPVLSFYEVWQMAQQGNTGFFRKHFEDKIVLIGPSNIYSQDYKPTPFYRSHHYTDTRQTSGVEIIANTINTILDTCFIVSLENWQIISVIFLLGIVTSCIAFLFSPVYGGMISFAFAVGYVLLCIFLFNSYNLNVKLISPVCNIPLTYTAVFAYRYTIEDKEKRRVKRIFKHYVSEEVVEEILKFPGEIPLGGKRVQATILFSDIRSFTSLSENRDPQDVVSILNSYFDVMSACILKYKGTLDKYIGDGILAFFGAPIAREEHADLAVSSAIEMLTRLEELNKKLALNPPLRIGIGIHSGEAVVGNIGSQRKMEYTIIGDTVNTASRVEGLTKELKAKILLSEATYAQLKKRHNVYMEKEVILRGKTKSIRLYHIDI